MLKDNIIKVTFHLEWPILYFVKKSTSSGLKFVLLEGQEFLVKVGVQKIFLFFIPRHTIVAGYYGFTLVVCVSVRRVSVRPSIRPFFVFG